MRLGMQKGCVHYWLCSGYFNSYPTGEGGLWIVWLNFEWRKTLKKKKKRQWVQQSHPQCIQRNGTWEASIYVAIRTNGTSEVWQTVPLNNWNVNFKEREMPWKWSLHSFQCSSSHSNAIRVDNNVLAILPHLEYIWELHLLCRSK